MKFWKRAAKTSMERLTRLFNARVVGTKLKFRFSNLIFDFLKIGLVFFSSSLVLCDAVNQNLKFTC